MFLFRPCFMTVQCDAVTKENTTSTTTTSPKLAQSADQGLADIPASLIKDAGNKQEVLQRTQLKAKAVTKEVKEKTHPSPVTCTH